MKSVLGSLLIVLIGLAVVPARPAASATTLEWTAYPANISVSQSENGGHPVSQPYGWTSADEQGPIKVHGRMAYGKLNIVVSGTNQDGSQWSIDAAGAAELWARPSFHPTRRIPDNASQMAFDIYWGGGFGCGTDAPGWLDLLDVGFARDGKVTRLWYRYFFGCDSPGALMTGEVRFGYPEQPAEAAPVSVVFQRTQPAGTSPAVAVRVRRHAGSTVGAPRIAGANPSSFRILKDQCTGATSGPDCLVSVAMSPVGSGFQRATLEVPVGSTVVKVPLEGQGLSGTYRHVYVGDSQSVTGPATSADHNPSTALIRANRYMESYNNEALDLGSTVDGVGISLGVWAPQDQMLSPGTFTTADPPEYRKAYFEATYWTGVTGLGCSLPKDRATWTVHQFVRGSTVDPAYDVEYDHWCSYDPEAHLRGRFQYGARADVIDPAPASQLRESSGLLSWTTASDVVRTVVRARAGGASIPSLRYGDLLCSTAGTSCRIPASYSDGSLALAVFTVDAAGNVAAPVTYIRKGGTSVGIYKGTGTLSGRITDAERGYRLTGSTATLQRRKPGATTWWNVKTARSDGTGRYEFAVSSSLYEYRVSAKATTTHNSGMSRTLT